MNFFSFDHSIKSLNDKRDAILVTHMYDEIRKIISKSIPVVCAVILREYRPTVQRRIENAVSAHICRDVLRVIWYYVLVLRYALSIQAILKLTVINN